MSIVGLFLRMTSVRGLGRFLFGIGSSALIVFVVFIIFLGASTSWKRDPSLATTQDVTLTSRGVTVTTSDRTMTLDWRRISSAIELQKGFFFVFTGPPTLVLLPKRVIANDQDLTYVRGFVPRPFFRIERV
jgi:hypothetical protein